MLGLVITMIIVGLIAGALARLIVPGRQDMSVVMTIVIGIVGSFVGGFLGYLLFHKDAQDGFLQPAGIIGSVVYLQAMERTRDFAVLKATGSTNRTLVFGLAVQAVLLAVAAAIAAVGLAALLSPTMDMNIEIPSSAYVILPIVAIVVGLLSSLAGLRRAVSVDPALAFGG